MIEIDGAMVWSALLSLALLYMGHALRTNHAKAEAEKSKATLLADRLLIVETKMVEEARVREIINECLSDIKQTQVEIRSDIKGLAGEIHELAQMMVNHNLNG